MDSIQGFIIAGGASSRMGTDKARLVLGGRTFIERIAGELELVVNQVTLVGSPAANERIVLNGQSLPVVPDIYEKWGALGGLHAALAAAKAKWALVVACDLPFVTAELFRHLTGLRSDYEIVAPIQPDGRPQPLCACYRTAQCLKNVEHLIKGGERRPMTLLQSLRTRWVPFEEVAALRGAEQFFENVNTPADYVRAQQQWGSLTAL